MNCTELIQESAKRVLALGNKKLKNPDFYTCNEIERLCAKNVEELNLTNVTSNECARILRNYQIIFIDYLNSKDSIEILPENSAFIHVYCCNLYNDKVTDKPLKSPEFLAIRKEWLNFLVTGKLGEQDA